MSTLEVVSVCLGSFALILNIANGIRHILRGEEWRWF